MLVKQKKIGYSSLIAVLLVQFLPLSSWKPAAYPELEELTPRVAVWLMRDFSLEPTFLYIFAIKFYNKDGL